VNQRELLSFLESIGARPKKGLSQNFLIDEEVLSKIVELASIQPGDYVLEIGPGPGALTRKLLQAGAHLLAIEKDSLFAHHLPRLQTPDKRLETLCGDFLTYPIDSLPPRKWKVVANLPYNITTPILERLCEHASQFESFTIMVQKELADRMKAKPGTKAFGSLTLFLQFYTRYIGSFLVPPQSFYPAPSVNSTVLRLDTRTPPDIDPNTLFPLIHKAYQQRRKMLSTSLKTLSPHIPVYLESMGLSSKARPEELSLDQWIELKGKLTQE
jgi:16S rRNA (adenine1518-N6/adenine1519-N6)-dimethyltransferase